MEHVAKLDLGGGVEIDRHEGSNPEAEHHREGGREVWLVSRAQVLPKQCSCACWEVELLQGDHATKHLGHRLVIAAGRQPCELEKFVATAGTLHLHSILTITGLLHGAVVLVLEALLWREQPRLEAVDKAGVEPNFNHAFDNFNSRYVAELLARDCSIRQTDVDDHRISQFWLAEACAKLVAKVSRRHRVVRLGGT